MITSRGTRQDRGQGAAGDAEIQEPGARDLDLVAKVGHIELGQNVCCELPRIQFPLLGQSHQRVGLVIAEFWVWAGADKDGFKIRVRQRFRDGVAQSLFEQEMQSS